MILTLEGVTVTSRLNGFGRYTHQITIYVDSHDIDIQPDPPRPKHFPIAEIFLEQLFQFEELLRSRLFRLAMPRLNLRRPGKKQVEIDFLDRGVRLGSDLL